MTALAPTLEAFFTGRLVNDKGVSQHTIAAYRDTFRLLLCFAQARTGKQPSELEIEDLDATLITAFLNHLEHERGNSPRTRNARLAAIHSMFRFAALRHPRRADQSRDRGADQALRSCDRQGGVEQGSAWPGRADGR